MTCVEIAARILARLDDDPAAPGSVAPPVAPLNVPPEVMAGINEGQELASLLTLCLETSVPLNLPATSAYVRVRAALPDYLVPLRLLVNGSRVRAATLSQLDALDDLWEIGMGSPAKYVALGFNWLAVSPKPTVDMLAQFTYARSPYAMRPNDTPELPEEYHISLVDYGIYYSKRKEGGRPLERALGYFNRFLDDMTKLGDYVRAKGRAARYDVLPLELALYDRAALAAQMVGVQ